jgi:cation transport ATPase
VAGEVGGAIAFSRATMRKMNKNLFWAVGYNTVAFPIAMGLFYPALGSSSSCSSIEVAARQERME